MGETNEVEEKIANVSGALGQVKVSQGPGLPPIWVDMPAGVAVVWVGKTLVYSGLSPLAWTDLDLSGFESLGTNKALVMLAFNSADDMNALAVRAKDDTSEYFNVAVEANAYGVAIGHHDVAADMVLLVTTNAAGIIQWITESQQTANVYMLAYNRG